MSTMQPQTPAAAPDHVPADLVWDHDLEAFCHELDDPFLSACRLHEGPDIVWCRNESYGQPGWVLTRHALVREAFIDYEHFSSHGGSGIEHIVEGVRLNPIDYDPPQHTLYRQILNPLFTPKKVAELDDAVREVCDRLIAKFEGRGSCEFVEEFAIKFPSYIFLSLMGMPWEKLQDFLDWQDNLMRGEPMQRVAAANSIATYLRGFLAEQRKNPTTDLLKAIIAAQPEGRALNDFEVLGMLYTFYVGGLDTVYSTLGFTLRHLALHPELQTRLRDDPELIPAAVDEFLRAFSVVGTRRKVTKDFVFHGVQMRQGDRVLLPLFLAGRDPQVFDRPHEVIFDRPANPAGLPFGSGSHHCLGRFLARREIRIVLESFLARFDDIRIPPGETYQYHSGATFGVDRLPLAWDRRKA
jgi:cytochrome P450